MALGTLFGLIACVISVGGAIVAITTRLNHVSHLQTDVTELKKQKDKDRDELKKLIADLAKDLKQLIENLEKDMKHELDGVWKEKNKIKDEIKELVDRLSRLEGRLNGKS